MPRGRPSGEEGFAPAGSLFAAGVLAFAAAVPAVAFSPLGSPAASSYEIGAAARASAKAIAHVLFSITLPPCASHWRDDKASTQRGVELVVSPSTLHADSTNVASDPTRPYI